MISHLLILPLAVMSASALALMTASSDGEHFMWMRSVLMIGRFDFFLAAFFILISLGGFTPYSKHEYEQNAKEVYPIFVIMIHK